MNNTITAPLNHIITYQEYRSLVNDLLKKGESTSFSEKPDYLNYSKLANSRMKRLDKMAKLQDKTIQKLQTINHPMTWIVLTEGWCGDAAHILPYLNLMAQASEFIDLKLVLREENKELMQQFLTNGGEAIPKLIVIEEGKALKSWGPRPSKATQMVTEYKEKHGQVTMEFLEDLQKWYNADQGKNIQEDLLHLLDL